MSLMLQPLQKYADFSGRAPRCEYWPFVTAFVAVLLLGQYALAVSSASKNTLGTLASCAVLFVTVFGCFVPLAAVSIRRLHDRGLSGWWYLLHFVPLANLVVLVWYCLPGDEGDNKYGPKP